MSNTPKNMKKRLRAPRELVGAVKRGERVTPKRTTDTNATHIRRFSKAFAVYACAAALLVGGAAMLPSLIGGSGSPAAMGNSTPLSSYRDALLVPPEQIDNKYVHYDGEYVYYDDEYLYDGETLTGSYLIVHDYPIDSAEGELSVDISSLPAAPTDDEDSGWLNVAPATFDESMKATVTAKKVSSISYYHTLNSKFDPAITPLAYTVSTFEILSIEQDSDYYHSRSYEVGSTIKIIEWYAVCPVEDSPTGEVSIYRSYPYPNKGVEMPDLMEIGKTYRLSLVEGAALDVYDDVSSATCYESGTRRSGGIYLYGCHLIASDVEEVK